MQFNKVGNEKRIIKSGHTLSLIKKSGKIFAYQDGTKFKKINLWIGKNINSLKVRKTILKNRRWATAIKEGCKIYVFATRQAKVVKNDAFKFQEIYLRCHL